jgi:hypothetical protein
MKGTVLPSLGCGSRHPFLHTSTPPGSLCVCYNRYHIVVDKASQLDVHFFRFISFHHSYRETDT